MTNHFESTIEKVQEASQPQRVEALIDGICQQMQQQSGTVTPQELSRDLQAAKSQLVKAFNQRQQGG